MGNAQKHRGQQAEDGKHFHPARLGAIRQAIADYAWLLTRGYSDGSAALSLVGDRYRLTARQRQAVMRGACSDQARDGRLAREATAGELAQAPLSIDGYNVLITVESGLSGGILLNCRDRAWRDLASIHGAYRQVEETAPALRLIGEGLRQLGVSEAVWFLDAPVSNSGRLRQLMLALARECNFPWEVGIVNNPDKQLAARTCAAASSDGWVMDEAPAWFNLPRYLLQASPSLALIDVADEAGSE